MGIYIEQLEAAMKDQANEIDRLKALMAVNMTKREKFVGMAVQGLCARQFVDAGDIASMSIKIADALLKQLETKEEG